MRFIFVITVLFLHPMGVRDGGGGGGMCENMFVYELEERGGSGLKVCVSEGT